MDIQRKAFEESNNVNPDWSFKFDEELQQYIAVDFEMTSQVDEFNEHWDTFRAGWDAKAQAVPEGFVLVPKLSANFLFNIVPELGFKHQDQKDTVLYHLNYMASEFKDSAKKFIEADHAKQKEMIKAQEPTND